MAVSAISTLHPGHEFYKTYGAESKHWKRILNRCLNKPSKGYKLHRRIQAKSPKNAHLDQKIPPGLKHPYLKLKGKGEREIQIGGVPPQGYQTNINLMKDEELMFRNGSFQKPGNPKIKNISSPSCCLFLNDIACILGDITLIP
jgi:hypothetical protein